MPLILASEASHIIDKINSCLETPLQDIRIVTIATAMRGEENAHEEWYNSDRKKWKKHGITMPELFLEDFSNTIQLQNTLDSYDALFVCGGNAHYLLNYVYKSGFDQYLPSFLDKGGLYIGTCAGSMIMGLHIDHLTQMSCPHPFTLKTTKGLGYIDHCLVPHINWENRDEQYARYHKKLFGDWRAHPYPLLAMNDQQALYIKNNIKIIL